MNRGGSSRVLVASSEKVPDEAARSVSRTWQLAAALSLRHDVMLAVPGLTGLSHRRFAVLYYNRRNLALMARDCDVVVLDAAVIASHPGIVTAGSPVAVDLTALPAADAAAGRIDDAAAAALRSADFFFCPSDEERQLWLSALGQLGRVNPHTRKAGLEQLIGVVRIADGAGAGHAGPLAEYCAAPEFAADRGTRYNRTPLPKPGEGTYGLSRLLARLRHHLRAGGPKQVASRSGSLIKRKIAGGRKI